MRTAGSPTLPSTHFDVKNFSNAFCRFVGCSTAFSTRRPAQPARGRQQTAPDTDLRRRGTVNGKKAGTVSDGIGQFTVVQPERCGAAWTLWRGMEHAPRTGQHDAHDGRTRTFAAAQINSKAYRRDGAHTIGALLRKEVPGRCQASRAGCADPGRQTRVQGSGARQGVSYRPAKRGMTTCKVRVAHLGRTGDPACQPSDSGDTHGRPQHTRTRCQP